MPRKFKVGDHVTWNSEAGYVSGTIIKVHTEDFDYKGYTHHASSHLVHAAAVGSGKFGFPFTNLLPSDWSRVLDVNVMGMVNVAHAVAPRMVIRGEGTMVFVASVAGQIGSQTDPPYSASKAANINFAQCLAKDMAPHNVRVNIVNPGMVRTPLNRQVWQAWNDQQSPDRRRSYEDWGGDKVRAVVPLGRWQEPEDVADMVAFLSSARAGQVTGHDVKFTNTGNVIAHFPGKGRKVVIFGHADEICYYVRQITDDGFLKCIGMTGRMDKIGFPYTIIGQKALVIGENADARGVFTTKSGHLLTENERSKPIEYSDVICDIGANSSKEVEELGIHIASPIIWNPTTDRLGDKVFGKAMDDRLAHAIEIELAEKLVGANQNCDLYLASTIQEEHGLKGASDLSRGGYDISIALDIGIAGDYPAIGGAPAGKQLAPLRHVPHLGRAVAAQGEE